MPDRDAPKGRPTELPKSAHEAAVDVARLWLSAICDFTVADAVAADFAIRDAGRSVPVWVKGRISHRRQRRPPKVRLGLRYGGGRAIGLALTVELVVPAASGQWIWMKSYRVWEADRVVFVYPESWVEPGSRPENPPQGELPSFERPLPYRCEMPDWLREKVGEALHEIRT